MSLEVKIEIKSTVEKKKSHIADGNTHNFIVCVQGLNGSHIEHFIKQIIFYLPLKSESRQVRKKPPYFIQGSTHSSFRLTIDLFFHSSQNIIKTRYSYYLFLPDKPVENAVCVKTLKFLNTPQDFKERLLLGGAEEIQHPEKSKADAIPNKCKSERVERIENKEVTDSKNTSEKNDKQMICTIEPAEDISSIQEEIRNQLPNTCVQNEDISEQSGIFVIQNVHCFDESLKENEILKKENETLKNRFSNQESIIATYVEKLPVIQNDFTAVSAELNELKQKAEANEAQISTLKSAVHMLMSEIHQHKAKMNESKEKIQNPETSVASSSSFASNRSSPSLENESRVNNTSLKILLNEKERIVTNKLTSHTSLDFPTISADPNIMSHACKIQHNFINNISEDKAISNSVYLNNNINECDIVQANQKALNCNERNPNNHNNMEISPQQEPFTEEPCKNILELTIQKCIKSKAQSSLEREHVEPFTFDPKESDPLIFDFENENISKTEAQQCVEFESSLQEQNTESGNLNADERNHVMCDFQDLKQNCFQKELCKNISQLPIQNCIRRESQETSLEVKDAEHAIFSSKNSIKKLSTPNDSGGRHIDLLQTAIKDAANNYKKDKVFSSNHTDTEFAVFSCSKRDSDTSCTETISMKENSLKEKPNENVFEEVMKNYTESEPNESIIKRGNAEFINLNDKEANPSSNIESVSTENSVQNESTKYLVRETNHKYKKDELQASLLKKKDTESVKLNYQETNPIVSNSHQKKSRLNRKRVSFFPISGDRKKLCIVKPSLLSVKEDLSSAPLNVPDSITHSTVAKEFSLPDKSSIDAKTSFPAPLHFKNATLEYANSSNSVDRNLHCATKSSNGQSARNKHLKYPNSGTKLPLYKIKNIFKNINERQIFQFQYKSYVDSLIQFLVNPINAPDISTLIYLVIHHLGLTEINYLKAFKEDRANCIFLPSSESCIVSALFEIENKSKAYAQLKLIANTLTSIHQLSTTKKHLKIYGLTSLCRVFTEICRRKGDLTRPLSLCADLLKVRHKFAPYLIASIAGVWREPFMMSNDHSDEAMIFIGAISLGTERRPKKTADHVWICSRELISEYFGFPSLQDVNIAVNFLKNKIISNCTQNLYEKSWMMTSSLVILAAHESWEWTQKHLIDDFIIPNLSRFSSQELNKKAFALFCELYVDVCILSPNESDGKVLIEYFKEASNKATGFVQESAKISWMKFMILKGCVFRGSLSRWFEKNRNKLKVETFSEMYDRRHLYCKKGPLKIEDIIVT